MKIRNTYLLFIAIIGLVSLAMYTTYALFTASIDVGEFVNLTASSLPTDTSIVEYERLTLNVGERKIIDLNITNNTKNSLYYGVWYEMIEPTTINDNIVIAKLDTSASNTIGQLTSNTSNVVTLIIENNTTDTLVINLGVGYSETSSLNLPTTRELVTKEVKLITNLDQSGANTPDLVDGLIPVMYNGSNWVKTSSENDNETYQWYDYNAKKWANAVLVSSTNRSKYQSADPGTVVSESDVLAYYVWIPRYRYKVWNINKVIGTDSYSARTTGIDIEFEPETETNGTIKCTSYSFASPTSSTRNETCSGTNGSYYTHPAFTFGDNELRGIWVGKFEISSSSPTSLYGGSNSTSLTVRTKPGVNSWRNNPVSNFSIVIQNMQASGNSYGLTTDKTKVDSHMLKNMEWGAVAYLTNSDYGRCSNNKCSEVAINSHYSGSGSSRLMYTGCGPQSSGSTSSGSTCNAYTSTLGQTASTTGNVYGVYDMSGGAYEYVMGNTSSAVGSYTYNASSAGSNFSYSTSTAKYIDTYANGTSSNNQTAYNRARLGDATGEVVVSSGTAWNSDSAIFVYSASPWFTRSGYYGSGTEAGPFYFYYIDGLIYYSTRAALIAIP